MTTTDLMIYASTIGVAIITWFLKGTMDELKTTKERSISNETKLALLEQKTTLKHDTLENTLEELKEVIKEMTHELKAYNNKN